MTKFKFKEMDYIDEIYDYIEKTYSQHYAKEDNAPQTLELTYGRKGRGTGFNIGSILKYADRYGEKAGYNRADIMKVIHYGILQLYIHDKENLSGKPVDSNPSGEV